LNRRHADYDSAALTKRATSSSPTRQGLTKHIHRIAASTLFVWGKADGIIAPAYADEFARGIALARVAMMDGVGHMPHFEQAENVRSWSENIPALENPGRFLTHRASSPCSSVLRYGRE
jgi:pimeloyl-ACP methyl ester carboxylesterase